MYNRIFLKSKRTNFKGESMYGLDLPKKLRGLDLFTGIGGITIALQDYVRPLVYCEIEPYCQSILLQRMQEGNLPKAPIWDDVHTLPTNELPRIDIIYAGFPCQDISIAGRQKGLEGKRSGLVFEIFRLLDETQAPFVFLENVPNIRTKGAERICKELSERGYDCRWGTISARDVGALHKRERFFLLGYSEHNGLASVKEQGSIGQTVCNNKEGQNETGKSSRTNTSGVLSNTTELGWSKGASKSIRPEKQETSREDTSNVCETLSDSERSRLYKRHEYKGGSIARYSGVEQSYWSVEPDVGRVVNGLSNRIHRIKALGNAVVPLQVKTAFEILLFG